MKKSVSSFVHGRSQAVGRSPSPQNGSNTHSLTNATRAVNAANARIPVKQLGPQSPGQIDQSLPSHGLAIAHYAPGAVLRAPSRQKPKQEQQHDAFDTDAESLDTTLDQAVLMAEAAGIDYQQHHVTHVGRPGDELHAGLDDSPEGEEQIDNENLTRKEMRFLKENDMLHLSHEMRVVYLQNIGGQLPTVEGDSYPDTTNGDYAEDLNDQEHAIDEEEDTISKSSPSPEHYVQDRQLPAASQPFHRIVPQTVHQRESQFISKTPNIIQQSARLRDQERLFNALGTQNRVDERFLDKSQPGKLALQDQASCGAAVANVSFIGSLSEYPRSGRTPALRQEPASVHFASQVTPSITDASRQAFPVPQVRPNTSSCVDSAIAQNTNISGNPGDRDYDDDVLFAMSYSQLGDESFDTVPRTGSPVLKEHMQHKPLADRLDFIQKNVDVQRHSDFFHSLSTTDWEEAGDWFLDQFSVIIQQSKQARQKKRKLVQEFEYEIEKRYKYVAGKQQDVEAAMSKMKAQGEGLVPRTPAAFREPKTRK